MPPALAAICVDHFEVVGRFVRECVKVNTMALIAVASFVLRLRQLRQQRCNMFESSLGLEPGISDDARQSAIPSQQTKGLLVLAKSTPRYS